MYSKSRKESVTVKAKVDTGAYYSSVDTQIAQELGYGDATALFEKYEVPDFFPTEAEAKKWQDRLHNELTSKNEDIVNTHIIANANGRSYRIAINLLASIDEKLFTLEVNIKDRSQLKYSMVIGRRDLKDFLVDPTLGKS